jgi:hypothetical protein
MQVKCKRNMTRYVPFAPSKAKKCDFLRLPFKLAGYKAKEKVSKDTHHFKVFACVVSLDTFKFGIARRFECLAGANRSLIFICCASALISFILVIATPQRAYACTPPPGSEAPTLQEQYELSNHVFRGTVIATNVSTWSSLRYLPPMVDQRGLLGTHSERFFDGDTRGYYAYIQVEAYYKGGGMGEVVVLGFGGGGDCLNTVVRGEDVVFFASGDTPFLDAQYAGYPYSAVASASPHVLSELEAITGKPPTLPDTTRAHIWLPLAGVAAGIVWAAARGAKLLVFVRR